MIRSWFVYLQSYAPNMNVGNKGVPLSLKFYEARNITFWIVILCVCLWLHYEICTMNNMSTTWTHMRHVHLLLKYPWEGCGNFDRWLRKLWSLLGKDGSGSGLGPISAGFGFPGFGFGFWFSPTVLRVRIPEIFRVWGGFSVVPAELHWASETNQPSKSPVTTLGI